MISTPSSFRSARRVVFSLLLVGVSIGLVGCGGEPEPAPPTETEAEPVARPAPIRRPGTEPSMATAPQERPMPSANEARYQFVPQVEGQLEEAGNGLDMIIDGSSEAAFNDSLATIAEFTSAEQYTSLERAIRFVNTYDPSILGNSSMMREKFDGMTAQEIIDTAAVLSAERYDRYRRNDG